MRIICRLRDKWETAHVCRNWRKQNRKTRTTSVAIIQPICLSHPPPLRIPSMQIPTWSWSTGPLRPACPVERRLNPTKSYQTSRRTCGCQRFGCMLRLKKKQRKNDLTQLIRILAMSPWWKKRKKSTWRELQCLYQELFLFPYSLACLFLTTSQLALYPSNTWQASRCRLPRLPRLEVQLLDILTQNCIDISIVLHLTTKLVKFFPGHMGVMLSGTICFNKTNDQIWTL